MLSGVRGAIKCFVMRSVWLFMGGVGFRVGLQVGREWGMDGVGVLGCGLRLSASQYS